MLSDLSEVIRKVRNGYQQTVAVVAAEDEQVLKSIRDAVNERMIIPLLIGNKKEITRIAHEIGWDVTNVDIIDNREGGTAAARIAVNKVKNGEADSIMKGFIPTNELLKVVLDKNNGLRTGRLLSHLAFFRSPYYHKIFCVTDAAMNIAPGLDEKVQIIRNAVEACHRLGIEKPKVAIAAAVESVNPKMEATVHASLLKEMNKEGTLTGCVVDGPFAIDIAVSRDAARCKGIGGEVAGDCDVILVPDIEAGNILYKALNFLGGAVSAAVVMGASVPVILTSRSDDEQSKLASIMLAACIRHNRK